MDDSVCIVFSGGGMLWSLSVDSILLSSCTEHFTCVVKMLYNLQFTQALAALSSKFSPEERQAWSTPGALKKVTQHTSQTSGCV